METKTLNLKSNNNSFYIDGYQSILINQNNIDIVYYPKLHNITYYMRKQCIEIKMNNNEIEKLYFLNENDALEEFQKINKILN